MTTKIELAESFTEVVNAVFERNQDQNIGHAHTVGYLEAYMKRILIDYVPASKRKALMEDFKKTTNFVKNV